MSIGIWQVILILLIVLILFGAGKIPKVMGDIAKGVKNFKVGMREDSLSATEQTETDHIPNDVQPQKVESSNPPLKKDEISRE